MLSICTCRHGCCAPSQRSRHICLVRPDARLFRHFDELCSTFGFWILGSTRKQPTITFDNQGAAVAAGTGAQTPDQFVMAIEWALQRTGVASAENVVALSKGT